ncbi:MAG: YeeE/YedE family protein [Verrucomicrobiales bacterium]|nr:YeeE/YedE family protein [Verrucomicrobiales bacterium]
MSDTPAPSGGSKRPRGRWNPYVVGAGIGLLSWAAFAVVNTPLGITSSLEAVAGLCAEPVLGAKAVAKNAYLAKHPFAVDYGTLFLAGTFLGALLSALLSKTWKIEVVPAVWKGRFGGSAVRRLIAAFLGGVIIMFGARLAGGCTSGHGISGSLQLAVSSWTFFLTLFATGVVTAWILFRKSEGKEQ